MNGKREYMGGRSVNNRVRGCSHRSLYHATRDRSNFGYLIVEMMHVWDLRVQSRHP
jgi:hypothetical protein